MSPRLQRVLIIFAILSIVVVQSVTAQTSPGVNTLTLQLGTGNPSPGQSETVTAISYLININSATLTWSVNGKQVQKGVGLTTYTTAAPALGKKLIVTVTAVTPDGQGSSAAITIISGSIDMVLESAGYVPPFFKGKIPLTYENTFTVIAVPHILNSSGTELDPKTLVYSWQRNGQVIANQSGYGHQSITLAGDSIPRPYLLSVIATSRDGSLQAAGNIGIQYVDPTIGFYVNDPLYGPLYNVNIQNDLNLGSQAETGVIAVPFGFNKPTRGLGDLAFSWSVNGLVQPGLSTNQSLILRAPDAPGTSEIALAVQNTKDILQKAQAGFNAVFNANTEATSTGTVNF